MDVPQVDRELKEGVIDAFIEPAKLLGVYR